MRIFLSKHVAPAEEQASRREAKKWQEAKEWEEEENRESEFESTWWSIWSVVVVNFEIIVALWYEKFILWRNL